MTEPLPPTPPRALDIISAVAARYGVTVAELRSRTRPKNTDLACARQDAAWALRQMTYGAGRPSLPLIGRWLRRDHTTILHSLRRHEARLAEQAVAA